MKKSWKRFLAIAVVLVLTLCVLSSCGDNTQAKIDEAVKKATDTLTKEKDDALKAAQDAADAVKTELEGKVAELTTKLTEAEESAKTAAEAAVKDKEDAVAAAKAEAEEAAKTASEAATKALDDAVAAAKTEAEAAAKTASEAAAKEMEDALAAAKTAADDALKAAQDSADAVKTELEGKVADLTKKLEDAEAAALAGADEAVKNAQAAADATIKELQDKLTAAEASAKTAVEDALKEAAEKAAKEKDEAVAAVQAAADEAAAAKAELEAKVAELETKVADYEKQLLEAPAAVEGTVEEKTEANEGEAVLPVLTHEEYINADLESEVTVETYVQDTQSWWQDKITVYAQSPDGAYFIYNMNCSEEDSKKLVPGTKIKVHGFKSEWAGETEIIDATFEFVEGEPFIAEPFVMDSIGGSFILHQNELVTIKGLTVVAQDDGAAFNYKDAVGKTDDLYFKATKGDLTISFCVEFYLRGQDTDVYKAVEALQVGDVIDVTGYLYWYNEANPHVIAVTKAQ